MPLGLGRPLGAKGLGVLISSQEQRRSGASHEVGFIVSLFYANLLMGEFERSGMGPKRGLVWAFRDVLTRSNLLIAAIAGLVGYLVFQYLWRASGRILRPSKLRTKGTQIE